MNAVSLLGIYIDQKELRLKADSPLGLADNIIRNFQSTMDMEDSLTHPTGLCNKGIPFILIDIQFYEKMKINATIS